MLRTSTHSSLQSHANTYLKDHVTRIVHPKVFWCVSRSAQLNGQTVLQYQATPLRCSRRFCTHFICAVKIHKKFPKFNSRHSLGANDAKSSSNCLYYFLVVLIFVFFSMKKLVLHSRLVFSRRFHCHDWNGKRINNIELVECPAHPNKMKPKEERR